MRKGKRQATHGDGLLDSLDAVSEVFAHASNYVDP
jgi:hypothetical protein